MNRLEQVQNMFGKARIPTISYCQISSVSQLNNAIFNALTAKPFVDNNIIITDKVDNDIKDKVTSIIFIEKEYNDNEPEYRNTYLDKARELNSDYVLVTDSDEHICEKCLSNLRAILISAPTYNWIEAREQINVQDYELLDEEEALFMHNKNLGAKWRLICFKLEPGVHYEGIGETKTSHPTLVNTTGKWESLKLPEYYYFTHTKNIRDIYRSSMRNTFISGGGLSVGSKSEFYNKLKDITKSLGLYTWNQFEEYINKGNIDSRLKDLFIEYKDFSTGPESHEYRSFFRYYFNVLHPNENINKLTSKFNQQEYNQGTTPIYNFVKMSYINILKRDPDEQGLYYHIDQIESKKLKHDELISGLIYSDECINNYIKTVFFEIFNAPVGKKEMDAWSKLLKSKTITDLAELIKTTLNKEMEFYNKIAYCQITYKADVDKCIENINHVKQYVDDCIVVYDQSVTKDQIDKLNATGAITFFSLWKDNFPEYRNIYLNVARSTSAAWVLVSDNDEHFDDKLLKDLKNITQQAKGSGISVLQVNARDIFLDDEDGNITNSNEEHHTDYYKGLIFQLLPYTYYRGVGKTMNVHEDLVTIGPRMNLPSEYFYRHVKTHKEIWEHAARNLFIGGGGDNLGDINKAWTELKAITNRLNLKTWKEFNNYLIAGNIDQELRQWIIDHRNDYRGNVSGEHRDFFRYYFKSLHPEENVEKFDIEKEPPKEVTYTASELIVINAYKDILKRNADFEGMMHYSKEIDEGRLDEQKLRQILMSSDEYKNMIYFDRSRQQSESIKA